MLDLENLLENLPPVLASDIKKQLETVEEEIKANSILEWINTQLEYLESKNKVLYRFLSERAKRLAFAATNIGDVHSTTLTMAVEYIILLRVLGASIQSSKFLKTMEDWFPGDELKGLDDIKNE